MGIIIMSPTSKWLISTAFYSGSILENNLKNDDYWHKKKNCAYTKHQDLWKMFKNSSMLKENGKIIGRISKINLWF